MLAVDDAGDGPAVVLLHGQPGTAAAWAPVRAALVGAYRVVVPDRPGYGATDVEAMGIAANAAVMVEMMAERGLAPAIVVGHSWGGGVAAWMAAWYPEAVRGIVLVGSVGTADSVNGVDRVLAWPWAGEVCSVAALVGISAVLPWLRRRAGSLPPALAEPMRRAFPDEGLPGGVREAWGRTMRSFVLEQRALVAELPDLARSLPAIGVPAVVLAGTRDLVVPPRSARTLAGAVPTAELVELADAGHFIPRDAPAAVAAAVDAVAARSAG